MSLYRFKSRETADLIMLEPHGKRILQVLGKDPAHQGILLAQDMPAAIEKLRAAAQAEEEAHQRMREEAEAAGDPPPQFDAVSLRVRSAPFIEMLQRCIKADVELVWGV